MLTIADISKYYSRGGNVDIHVRWKQKCASISMPPFARHGQEREGEAMPRCLAGAAGFETLHSK